MNSRASSKNIVQPPTRLPNTITRVLSWGYAIGIGYQNRKFDRGVGVTKIGLPVISVGNLSAGGTGKTPMVHCVVKHLLGCGKNPVIAMRGYRAAPGEMGDEEREHREALPGIPIVAQPDRISGLHRLIESQEQIDCVVLDDGFQHRQIARDLDIVLIDASSPPYRDAILPRGYLRDPVSSLSRADMVVITHKEMVNIGRLDELVSWLESNAPNCPLAIASHTWGGVDVYTMSQDGWESEQSTLDQLVGERVLGVCAIGNPDGFFRLIESSGWEIADRVVLNDHDPFEMDVVAKIEQRTKLAGISAVCMTRKDWVKAKGRLDVVSGIRVIVPELGIEIESGRDHLNLLIEKAVGQE